MRLTTRYRHSSPGYANPPAPPASAAPAPTVQPDGGQRQFAPPPPLPATPVPNPTQGQGAPAPQGPPVVTPDSVIRPEDYPQYPELHGRTVRDAMGNYQIMREFFQEFQPLIAKGQLVRKDAPAGQQPAAPAAPTPPKAGDPRASFFADPEAAIERVVGRMLAPVLQQNTVTAAQAALSRVRQEIPDFNQYEGTIMAALANADPSVLSNPDTLRAAYFHERGKRDYEARRGGTQPVVPTAPAAPQRPLTPQQSPWFTEAPNAPPPQQPSAAPAYGVATEQDKIMARKFDIPVENYLAFSGRGPMPGASNGQR